ncbi:MAG: hypothetical protein L6W00_17655 [Lentisphaeria bacterium]|nr:MAG: hypothetical protein L6W00_17655 [Lentisphaeria bacterium]
MKKLLLPLLFLTTLSLSAEVIHEQKWDASFTTKEVIFNNRRLEKGRLAGKDARRRCGARAPGHRKTGQHAARCSAQPLL